MAGFLLRNDYLSMRYLNATFELSCEDPRCMDIFVRVKGFLSEEGRSDSVGFLS